MMMQAVGKKRRNLSEGSSFPTAEGFPYFIIGGRKRIKAISCGRNGKKKGEANCLVPFLTGTPGLLSHQIKMGSFFSGPNSIPPLCSSTSCSCPHSKPMPPPSWLAQGGFRELLDWVRGAAAELENDEANKHDIPRSFGRTIGYLLLIVVYSISWHIPHFGKGEVRGSKVITIIQMVVGSR